jgi:hypothetical protein
MRSCLLGCLAAFPARLAIIVLVIFTDYIGRGFQGSFWWPFLGWFFAPCTTLAYAWANNASGFNIHGPYILPLILGVVIDLWVAFDGGRGAAQVRRVYVQARDNPLGAGRPGMNFGGPFGGGPRQPRDDDHDDNDGRENVRVRR